MNNNEWITDRLPTEEDADNMRVWMMRNGEVVVWTYDQIDEGDPWMPINRPKPYVKPKRWKAEYVDYCECWLVVGQLYTEELTQLHLNNDEHRKAAERIAEIYEEVLP